MPIGRTEGIGKQERTQPVRLPSLRTLSYYASAVGIGAVILFFLTRAVIDVSGIRHVHFKRVTYDCNWERTGDRIGVRAILSGPYELESRSLVHLTEVRRTGSEFQLDLEFLKLADDSLPLWVEDVSLLPTSGDSTEHSVSLLAESPLEVASDGATQNSLGATSPVDASMVVLRTHFARVLNLDQGVELVQVRVVFRRSDRPRETIVLDLVRRTDDVTEWQFP